MVAWRHSLNKKALAWDYLYFIGPRSHLPLCWVVCSGVQVGSGQVQQGPLAKGSTGRLEERQLPERKTWGLCSEGGGEC